jgi:hypothetical protein
LALKARASLCWVNRNLVAFTPWQGSAVSPIGGQALGELAFLTAHVDTWIRNSWPIHQMIGEELEGAFSQWVQHISGQIEDALYVEMCRKRVADGWKWLFPYLCLRTVGYRHTSYESLIETLLDRGYLLAPERAPYRTMEAEYLLYKAGISDQEPDWRDLIARGSLVRWRDPLYLPDDAVYALTHTVMYASDLGGKEIPLTPAERRQVVEIAECLIVHYSRESFWDLLGELLILVSCLGAEARSRVAALGANALTSAWRSDGSLLAYGQSHIRRQSDGATSQSSERLEWDDCYHTTLVWLMFVATFSKSQR